MRKKETVAKFNFHDHALMTSVFLIGLIIVFLVGVSVGDLITGNVVVDNPVDHLWSGENNADDSLGTNNGKLKNGVAFASGKTGQAFSFDGIDDYVLIPDSTDAEDVSFDFIHDFTISFWVKLPSDISTDAAYSIVSKRKSSDYTTPFNVGFRNGALTFTVGGGALTTSSNGNPLTGTYNFLKGNSTLPLGEWVLVDAVMQGNMMKLYVNGVSVGSRTYSGKRWESNNTSPLMLGVYPPVVTGNRNYLKGYLDEVKIYNRALSDSEIASTPGLAPTASCTDGVKNGDETDVDCGGSCTTKCGSSKSCLTDNDCNSNYGLLCHNTVKKCTSYDYDLSSCIRTPTSTTLKSYSRNSDGGRREGLVTVNDRCNDVNPKLYHMTTCAGYSFGNNHPFFLLALGNNTDACGICTDGIKNQGEIGIDCGAPCVACASASCTDGVRNGDETDVDCGGSCTTKCGSSKSCLTDNDCTSNLLCDASDLKCESSVFSNCVRDDSSPVGDAGKKLVADNYRRVSGVRQLNSWKGTVYDRCFDGNSLWVATCEGMLENSKLNELTNTGSALSYNQTVSCPNGCNMGQRSCL